MNAKALRAIEADLLRMVDENEIDPDLIRVCARRVGAQAEMIEEGVE